MSTTCARCACRLSRYRHAADITGLCAPCQAAQQPRQAPTHRRACKLCSGPVSSRNKTGECATCRTQKRICDCGKRKEYRNGMCLACRRLLQARFCKAGHEKTKANTYTYPDGRTECRTCRRAYSLERWQAA